MIVTYQTHCTINILQHLNMMLVVVKSPFHFLKEEEKNKSISKKLMISSESKCTSICIDNVCIRLLIVWFYFLLLFVSHLHNNGMIKSHNCTLVLAILNLGLQLSSIHTFRRKPYFPLGIKVIEVLLYCKVNNSFYILES